VILDNSDHLQLQFMNSLLPVSKCPEPNMEFDSHHVGKYICGSLQPPWSYIKRLWKHGVVVIVSSWTGQVTDWTVRGLVKSWISQLTDCELTSPRVD